MAPTAACRLRACICTSWPGLPRVARWINKLSMHSAAPGSSPVLASLSSCPGPTIESALILKNPCARSAACSGLAMSALSCAIALPLMMCCLQLPQFR